MEASLLIRLIDQVTGPAAKVRAALTKVGDVAGEFRRGFGSAIRRGLSADNIETATKNAEAALTRARGRLLGAIGTAMMLAAPVRVAGQFDQAFKGLEKVLDVSVSRLAQLRRYALETSALIPIAAKDVIELMAEAAQGGVPQQELEAFSRYVANAAVAFDMAGAEIGERFAKLRNVYKLNQDGVEALGDATNHLSNNMAAKAREITDFTNRAAGAAAIFKLTAIEASAFGTAMIAAGIVPETAARGFTAMATRILSGGKDVDKAFRSLGLNRKKFLKELETDGAGALVKLFETMAASKKGMQALIDIAGRDFADDFAKLIGNPELLAQALRLVSDEAAYAGSATEEAAKQAAGAVRRWELLANKLTRTAIIVGDQLLPVLLAAADAVGDLIDRFAAWADANPELASGAVQAVAALAALSVASRLLAYAVAAIRLPLIQLVGTFLKFDGAGRNVAAGWRALAGAGRVLMLGVAALKWGLAGLVALLGGVTAPVWAVVAALAAAAFGLWKYWDRVSAFVSGFASVFGDMLAPIGAFAVEMAEAAAGLAAMAGIDLGMVSSGLGIFTDAVRRLFDVTAWIAPARAALAEVGGWFSGLFSQESLSGDQQAAIYDRGRQMAQALVDGIRTHVQTLIAPIKSLFDFAIDIDWPEPPAWLLWLVERAGGVARTVTEAVAGAGEQGTSGVDEGGFRAWIAGQWDGLVGSGRDLAAELLGAGTSAGDRLGGAATEKLLAGAASAGATFGKAAAAEIGRASVRVTGGGGSGLAGTLDRATSGALHDGVD